MQKRERILVIVLAVVGVIAVVIVLFSMNQTTPPPEDIVAELDLADESQPSQGVEQLVTTIGTAKSVLSSDKFLMLTTFGKVPVTVNPEEMGKAVLF
ncbi:hypothetical protein ACFL0Z_00970 [Patescibacteria group bacterium]